MYAGIVYCGYSVTFMIRILVKYTSLFVHQQVTFTFSLNQKQLHYQCAQPVSIEVGVSGQE